LWLVLVPLVALVLFLVLVLVLALVALVPLVAGTAASRKLVPVILPPVPGGGCRGPGGGSTGGE
jgi:hypothetical protein